MSMIEIRVWFVEDARTAKFSDSIDSTIFAGIVLNCSVIGSHSSPDIGLGCSIHLSPKYESVFSLLSYCISLCTKRRWWVRELLLNFLIQPFHFPIHFRTLYVPERFSAADEPCLYNPLHGKKTSLLDGNLLSFQSSLACFSSGLCYLPGSFSCFLSSAKLLSWRQCFPLIRPPRPFSLRHLSLLTFRPLQPLSLGWWLFSVSSQLPFSLGRHFLPSYPLLRPSSNLSVTITLSSI